MDKLARFIDVSIPVQTCNLRCPYCYIAQKGMFLEALPYFRYDADTIGRAMSAERLGGICHLNLCGGGETLLPPQMKDILYKLLECGHYVAVVTNGTVTKRFKEIAEFPEEFRSRLLFKFSFHYSEFKRLNLFDTFWGNVHMMQKAGCSFSIELTPTDDMLEYAEDIKAMCLKEVGAPCHVTVARVETDPDRPILTKYSKEDYLKAWGSFDSDLFRFKLSTFNVKRREFCYAGLWTGSLNLGTGILRQCYCGAVIGNILENPDKPIKWNPVGCSCPEPHCHNSHVWLTLGNIPELKDIPTYTSMRNRKPELFAGAAAEQNSVCMAEWLTPGMQEFLSQKLYDNHEELSEAEKKAVNRRMRFRLGFTTAGLKTVRAIRRHMPKNIRKKIAGLFRKY